MQEITLYISIMLTNHIYFLLALNMVFVLDGNSEIVAHVRSNLCYLIRIRHLIKSKTFKDRMCFLRKDLFSCMVAHNVLSYHLIYTPWIRLGFQPREYLDLDPG